MSALEDFVKYAKSLSPAGASGSGGTGPAGGGNAGGPGGGNNKKGVSFAVYNPGNIGWGVISGDEPDSEADSSSAGAIRRGTKYDDYDGWQDSSNTYTYKSKKARLLVLTFDMSARVGGTPKDDPGWEFYVAEVRVKGKKTGIGGLVSAQVEGVRALWEDSGHVEDPDIDLDYRNPGTAAVAFTLVIRIRSGPLDGGDRTVRIEFTVFGASPGAGVWKQGPARETPGV